MHFCEKTDIFLRLAPRGENLPPLGKCFAEAHGPVYIIYMHVYSAHCSLQDVMLSRPAVDDRWAAVTVTVLVERNV